MVGGATEEAVGKREGTQKKGDTTKSIGKCIGVLEMACKCIIHKRKEKKASRTISFSDIFLFFLGATCWGMFHEMCWHGRPFT